MVSNVLSLSDTIQKLNTIISDCTSDLNSSWIEESEKNKLTVDIALLRQARSLLNDLSTDGCNTLFNNSLEK